MRILSILLACLGMIASPSLSEPRTMRIASGEYAPFTGRALPDQGTVNHYIQTIADHAGIALEFDYMPWKRALESTRAGKYDGTSYWLFDQDRAADFLHVGPVVHDRVAFFVRADSPLQDWVDFETIRDLRIGVVPGYTYTPELWARGADGTVTLTEAPSDEANLRKLLAGRIDLFAMTDQVAWHLIQSAFDATDQARFRELPTSLAVANGYLLVPRAVPDAEQLAARLQEAADALSIGLSN